MNLSRLGFGVTGPHATPAVARRDTIALIHHAAALGVRVFDTGPMYGDGEAELRLGAALRTLSRDQVCVVTKARTWPLRAEEGAPLLTPAQRVRRSVEESLKRLGVAHVDALFLHGPLPQDFTPELAATLADLKSRGLIGAAGVCGRGVELDAALDAGGFDLLMMPVADAQARLARAAAQGVRVFAIETMRARAGRWRLPKSAADLWYLARAARDAATGVAAPVDTGIAGALSLPPVASVIVQTTRASHLEENARDAGL